MCFACLLESSNWDYWQLRNSNLLTERSRLEIFYGVLASYLNEYGPHHPNEILLPLRFFIPEEKRQWTSLRSEFDEYFLGQVFKPEPMATHGIHTTTFFESLHKYITREYDVIDFSLNSFSITGLFCEKPTDPNTPFFRDPLIYTTEYSLEQFMQKYSGDVRKVISFRVPSIHVRGAPHTSRQTLST